MNKTNNIQGALLTNIIYLSMIYTLTTLIGKVINLKLDVLDQIIIVIIISSIIRCFIIYPIFFFISSAIGFLSMLYINKYKFPIFLLAKDKSMILFSDIINNIQDLSPISHTNTLLFYLIIVIFVSSFTAFIIYKMKNIFILAPIYLTVFLIYWYSFIDEAYIYTAIFLFLFLILFGINKYKKNIMFNKKTLNTWSATSIIYNILIISIAFSLPKSNNYLSWPNLQEKVYDIFPVVEDLRYYKEYNRKTSSSKLFSFSETSFSEKDKDLGGPLTLSERKVMTVESKESIYLRGKVNHIYTGKKWLGFFDDPLKYNLKEDINFISDNEKDRFYTRNKIKVKFDSFSSKTIFTPYKPESIKLGRNFSIFVNNDDIVFSTDGVYKDESYTVEYLKPLPYEVLMKNRIDKRKTSFINSDIYLNLPEDVITNRTKELTYSLVEDMDSDYEKAIIIQDYLRNNYKYNLDVKKLPSNTDFVDHFLFEEKEGYCTYYASAMAVMLRLENIPTRYVEGYIVKEKIDTKKYQVRQKHAHAWVEAFIEPVGWVSFEPTAAYEPLDNEIIEEENISPDTEDDKEEIEDEAPSNLPIVEDEDDFEDKNNTVIDNQSDNNVPIFKIVSISLAIIFLLSFLIRILTRYLKYRHKEKYFNSLGDRSKIILLYKDITDLIDILGFPVLTGETHFEYVDRIDFKFIDSNGNNIKYITNIFVNIKYSDKKVLDTYISPMIIYKKDLDKKLQTKIGKFRYLYRKYINIYFKKKEIP
ncbi:MAG: transglutaminase-like domain-containing protein [Tissierella sp.]|uniref:transglutaminase-like domain-containing protein n=1 Tax=Tissierella sp. TaxID=41274 RepID=UPI003F98BD9B